MEQETLEEVAERIFPMFETDYFFNIPIQKREGFIEGAKWQAERMYNKEKVDKLLDTLIQNNMCSTRGDELIEQFKNK